jgi:MarR family transcriptional regulator, lower aerobic nicotinate degradation pathway regulator
MGPTPQNALGRATAMDAATIKGVIDRLRARGYVAASAADGDRRRVVLSVTRLGETAFRDMTAAAHNVTAETLSPLSEPERARFVDLLARLG